MSEEDDLKAIDNCEKTSLDYDVEESQPYNQYIQMLRNNNQVITMALHKAEDLIKEYKRDNEYLKERNSFLEKEITEMSDEVQYLKQVVFTNTNQDCLDTKIKELQHKNDSTQIKMKNLAEELEKSQRKVQKLTKAKQQSIERNFNNFFEFGVPSTFKTSQDFRSKEKQLEKEIRSLQWKLDQREDQITYMIRVNRILEEKVQKQEQEGISFRKSCNKQSQSRAKERFSSKQKTIEERFLTCSTEPNNRMRNFGTSPHNRQNFH